MKAEADLFIQHFAVGLPPEWLVNQLKKLGHKDPGDLLCVVDYFKSLSPECWIDIANECFSGESYEDFKVRRSEFELQNTTL